MSCFSGVLFCLLGLFASEFFSFFKLFSKSGSFFSCKFFSVLYFYSSCNISFPGINVEIFPTGSVFDITGQAGKKLAPALKIIDIAGKFRVFLFPAFGIIDETGKLREVLFPAELVVFITHHNFGSDIRLEFVDLLLFGNSFFVRVRV